MINYVLISQELRPRIEQHINEVIKAVDSHSSIGIVRILQATIQPCSGYNFRLRLLCVKKMCQQGGHQQQIEVDEK